MSATIRYNGSDGYVRDPDGLLVRYSDYQELQAKVERLQSIIREALKSMEGLEREPFVGDTFEILEQAEGGE